MRSPERAAQSGFRFRLLNPVHARRVRFHVRHRACNTKKIARTADFLIHRSHTLLRELRSIRASRVKHLSMRSRNLPSSDLPHSASPVSRMMPAHHALPDKSRADVRKTFPTQELFE